MLILTNCHAGNLGLKFVWLCVVAALLMEMSSLYTSFNIISGKDEMCDEEM